MTLSMSQGYESCAMWNVLDAGSTPARSTITKVLRPSPAGCGREWSGDCPEVQTGPKPLLGCT